MTNLPNRLLYEDILKMNGLFFEMLIIQVHLCHEKMERTLPYQGIEVDDA